MRVIAIDFPAEPASGLKRIRMERLGKVVVLAGKNGSGKSRLFSRLLLSPQQHVTPHGHPRSQIMRIHEEQAARLRSQTPKLTEEQISHQLAHYLHGVGVNRTVFDEIVFSEFRAPTIIPFVPTALNLTDPNSRPKLEMVSAAKQVEQIGVHALSGGALAHIQTLQDRNWEATHPRATFSQETKMQIVTAYEGLRNLVQKFLGSDLTRSKDGEAELFGMPMAKSGLSQGQTVLLQFCVAIHAQSDKLAELIVLMDEPENHLHPGAMLDTIEAIQTHLTDGQLWISTHSVPLLANLDPADVWRMAAFRTLATSQRRFSRG